MNADLNSDGSCWMRGTLSAMRWALALEPAVGRGIGGQDDRRRGRLASGPGVGWGAVQFNDPLVGLSPDPGDAAVQAVPCRCGDCRQAVARLFHFGHGGIADPLDLGHRPGLRKIAAEAGIVHLHRRHAGLAAEVDHLADEERQHAQDHEQAHRRHVRRALSGKVVAGQRARRQQPAQGAEDAAIEVPERFEHLFERMREAAYRAVRGLSAAVAERSVQRSGAVLACGAMAVAHRCSRVGSRSGLR